MYCKYCTYIYKMHIIYMYENVNAEQLVAWYTHWYNLIQQTIK